MAFNSSDYLDALGEAGLYEQNCTLADLRPHEFNASALDAYNISWELEESLMRCSYDARRINCSASDALCLCAKEIYRDYCAGRPEYYSYIYRIIGTLFQGIIFVIGVIGNAMVVIVVARNKNMATPTNCYLVSLAVADCAVLVAAVPQEIVSYFLIGNHWIWGRGGCAIMIFLQNLGINASSLSLTAFTVERYIAICHPMKAQTVCTVERAKKITLLVWLFAVCYCAPWLFLTQVVPLRYAVDYPTQECTFKLSRDQYLYYYFLDFVVFYVVPLLLSCVLYSLIARILIASQLPKGPSGDRVRGAAISPRVQVRPGRRPSHGHEGETRTKSYTVNACAPVLLCPARRTHKQSRSPSLLPRTQLSSAVIGLMFREA